MDSIGVKNLLVGLVLGIGLGVVAVWRLGLGVYVGQHWLLKLAFGYGCWTVGMLLWAIAQLVGHRLRSAKSGRPSGRD